MLWLMRIITNSEGRTGDTNNKVRCIYVGRLIPQKGIEELINFFRKHPEMELTLVGREILKKRLLRPLLNVLIFLTKDLWQIRSNYANYMWSMITYCSTLNAPRKLGRTLWDGADEGMSCGLVPVATDHVGPSEIIQHNSNGYVTSEMSLFSNSKKYFLLTPMHK